MYKIGGEEMVLCPYNRYHTVKKLRIQKHLQKCKKSYPEMKLATCVYNYTHRLKPEDLLEHYEICPQKIRLDGARYYEPGEFMSSSVKSEPCGSQFPDINVKARLIPEHNPLLLMDPSESQKLDYSSSDSEENNDQFKDVSQERDDNDSGEDDLEPLPLPKTVSKAFVCVQQEPGETSKPKGYGRGRSLLSCSPPRPERTTDHLLPHLSDVGNDTVKTDGPSWHFTKNSESICGQSIGSSMLEDTTTLKSMDVSIDENAFEAFILKDLDKYVKI